MQVMVGDIVHYTENDWGGSWPAIITSKYDDDSVDLLVFITHDRPKTVENVKHNPGRIKFSWHEKCLECQ